MPVSETITTLMILAQSYKNAPQTPKITKIVFLVRVTFTKTHLTSKSK